MQIRQGLFANKWNVQVWLTAWLLMKSLVTHKKAFYLRFKCWLNQMTDWKRLRTWPGVNPRVVPLKIYLCLPHCWKEFFYSQFWKILTAFDVSAQFYSMLGNSVSTRYKRIQVLYWLLNLCSVETFTVIFIWAFYRAVMAWMLRHRSQVWSSAVNAGHIRSAYMFFISYDREQKDEQKENTTLSWSSQQMTCQYDKGYI